MKKIIVIEVDNIGDKELERCRDIIKKLFDEWVFNVRNAKVSLNFDSDGMLGTINFDVTKWRRSKESLSTLQNYQNARIVLLQKHFIGEDI